MNQIKNFNKCTIYAKHSGKYNNNKNEAFILAFFLFTCPLKKQT